MKIDELISELEKVKKEHGNLSVNIVKYTCGIIDEIDAGELTVDLYGIQDQRLK